MICDYVSCSISKEPVPAEMGLPTTILDDADVRGSVSLWRVAEIKKFAAVSKLIFRKGEVELSIPRRLQALYPPV